MTTPFESYAFAPTGASATTTYPDRLDREINVREYGAVGDGSTDDTAAIQDALDAAFGSYASPNGNAPGQYLNKTVFFPPGNYRIVSELKVRYVRGGRLVGSGNGATTLTYSGAIAGGATFTNLFYANGLNTCRVQDIKFVMTGGNTLANNTVCFNVDWDNTTVNGSCVTFTNCGFSGATIGMLLGVTGFQCDETSLINCLIDNCYYGLWAANQNALNNGIYGGSITNCTKIGVYLPHGTMHSIIGVAFAGNNASGGPMACGDIMTAQLPPMFIAGCRSTSPSFFSGTGAGHHIVGCRHNASTSGFFAHIQAIDPLNPGLGANITIDSCHTTNGYVSAQTNIDPGDCVLSISNLVMDNPDWSHGSGFIAEWNGVAPTTFANLPSSSWRCQGLVMNITDCNTATWGANAAGGGSNHVSVRWNGSNWTVVGV